MNVIKTLIKMVTRKCKLSNRRSFGKNFTRKFHVAEFSEHCNKKCMVMSERKKLKYAQETSNE
ncbi:MAG: hypothetical protein QMC80_01845 [Thermoplasmatales archaeon]|nr:hypothetical protein [Thermoplasmatales archaeon]